MSDKGVPTTSALTLEQLGNLLLDPATRPAAKAEMRVREHRAILAQAECAEREAKAAERSSIAAMVYTGLTFCLLVSTILGLGCQRSCAGGTVSTPPSSNRPAATH